MNNRTAKLLHRFAALNSFKEREVKKDWNRTPRPLRAPYRQQLKDSVLHQLGRLQED